ncbi:amidohydrolase family protein [Amycolatopsis lurida]
MPTFSPGAISRRRRRPGGHFAALPLPDVDGAVAETRYALDVLGADGVAILSNAEGHYPGDPVLEPLLAELDPRSVIVFVHPISPPNAERVACGRPLPLIEFLFDSATVGTDHIVYGSDFCFTRRRSSRPMSPRSPRPQGPAPHRAWRDLPAANTRTLLGR